MKDIFSQLDFNNIDNIDLYAKSEENKKEEEETSKESIENVLDYLYDKKVICPVCGNKFKVKAVKTSSYRMKSKDSDFFIRYELISPYFYDVWLCNSCGYAAMKSDFERIKKYQKDLVRVNITPKWRDRTYKEPYDIDTAIERYKLSLLNYVFIEGKASEKAMNCLKLAWMYRLLKDTKNETSYLNQALKGFNEAYINETFPIYGMDNHTIMYLIGELNRRIGNDDEALLWLGKVITSTTTSNKRLKDMAREQRDLIKMSVTSEDEKASPEKNKKKGFFSSLFG